MATLRGVNIDLINPAGKIPVGDLLGTNLVRFPLNVRAAGGLEKAKALYGPYIASLIAVGITPVLVVTHQTWGEGEGFNFSDKSAYMSAEDWERLWTGNLTMLQNLIPAIDPQKRSIVQLWNEQDSEDDRASVIVPPNPYGQYVRSARALFGSTRRLSTGGYCSGAGRGSQQLIEANILAFVDFVAFHPYGQGAGGVNYVFGDLATELSFWKRKVAGSKLLCSEFGIMGVQPQSLSITYMNAAFNTFNNSGIAVAMWYAYDSGMDNCSGIRQGGVVNQQMRSLINGTGQTPQVPQQPNPTGSVKPIFSGAPFNLRATPGLRGTVIGKITPSRPLKITGQVELADSQLWLQVMTLDEPLTGWFSLGVKPVRWEES